MLCLKCKPFAMLKREAKAERRALVDCVPCALVNDRDILLLVTSNGVFVLTGGYLDSEQAACDRETGHNAYVVDVL